jgi:4-hydroxybutyryl-CoA dehydratase/vinylacetyl-CoA-Delta-isomerase
VTLLSADAYRLSLRELHPDVWVRGRRVDSVADEPLLAPGVNAIARTYEMALQPELAETLLAELPDGRRVNRMNALDAGGDDLLRKLEACRLLCRATGCAQRYLMHDAVGALAEITHLADAEHGTEYAPRLAAFVERGADDDLTCAVAMTDPKGDRSRRPHQQADPDQYLRVVERHSRGIVLRGAKLNVTGAPYSHEVVVLPTRAMTEADADHAVAAVVPIDAPGLRVISRPAGRTDPRSSPFSASYGQATAMLLFDDVLVSWERVLLCGEHALAGRLAEAFANHHRHSCIGCRAALGDIVIGAAVEMATANGLSVHRGHLRSCLAQLIGIVEGFYACGIAASVRGHRTAAGNWIPDGVYANVGKLMLAEQVPVMFRIAQEMAGGVVATVPTPEDVAAPENAELVRRYLAGATGGGAEHRINVARLLQDLSASDEGGWYALISLHGGGSPEALRSSAVRQYDLDSRRELARRLACFAHADGGCAGCGSCADPEHAPA